MNKPNLKRIAVILGGLVGTGGAAALMAVGCGGDDNVVNPGDSGHEAGLPDTNTPDVPHNDSPTADSPVDSPQGDAGNDSPATVDASVDAPTITAYLGAMDQAY